MQREAGDPCSVTACPVIAVYPVLHARTPRHLGFNVEIQTDDDRINLWDWLADSGATVLREFHPEVNMRRTPVVPGQWGRILTRNDFNSFRKRLRAKSACGLDTTNYRFDEDIPYLGVPDKILSRVVALGIVPMVPMGYVPKMFPRPLVRNMETFDAARDDGMDWEAAASAYEYYFTMAYHFSAKFGCRLFQLVNEPEYRFGGFYLPPEIEAYGNDLFNELFVRLTNVNLWNAYFRALAPQVAALARVARQALDDVHADRFDSATDRHLDLLGPVAGNLDAYWDAIKPYVDGCDYHQYSPHPESYRDRFNRASGLLRGTGKNVVLSEFNRQAGEMRVAGSYFPIAEALGLARIMMEIMQLSTPGDPVIEAATLYHFYYPATHRNYKSLVYGDMNRLDWTDVDARPSGSEMHPTTEEMQIRHATPAYHVFRMLARVAGCDRRTNEPHSVLRTSLTIRDTSLVPDPGGTIRVLAVALGGRTVITVLNSSPSRGDTVTLDVKELTDRYSWAVVRETCQRHWDHVVAELPVQDHRVSFPLKPESIVQVILSNIDPTRIAAAEISERTFTPGCAASLALLQTTRLRLTARVNGRKMDLTDHNVVWTSEDGQFVRVGPGGLVQRVRSTKRALKIVASLVDGTQLAERTVPADQQG
jgi:hypothetical protein